MKCGGGKCGNCISSSSLEEIYILRLNFWGDDETPAPSPTERRGKIETLLRNCYRKDTKTFKFSLNSGREVCEMAYRFLLGIGNASRQWDSIRYDVLNDIDSKQEKSMREQEAVHTKRNHATAFITAMATELSFSDANVLANKETIVIVPYIDAKQFYEEYQRWCEDQSILRDEMASLTTFRKSLRTL